MQKRGTWLRAGLTGAAAGAVNGLFGAGGGMLLLPLLHRLTDLREHEAFACSVCTMLPLSVVSLVVYWLRGGEFLTAALPYLAGGALGGIAAGLLLRRLSAVWLHRALGALIVWGGLRLQLRRMRGGPQLSQAQSAACSPASASAAARCSWSG